MNKHVRLDNELGRIASTKDAFLAFMAAQPEGRYEFEDGAIVQQMTGGTARHSLVATRFLVAASQQLDPWQWAIHGSDRGVDCGGQVRYPNMVIEPLPLDLASILTDSPALVLEPLSPNSERLDLGRKAYEYGALHSVQACVAASQSEQRCHVRCRARDGAWPDAPVVVQGQGATVDIQALGLTLNLDTIYAGLLGDLSGSDVPEQNGDGTA